MPEEAKKQVKYDVDGYEVMTTAICELLNQFPGLVEGEKITFSTLKEDEGFAMFPTSGAVIQSERESVTGHVSQECQYPFAVVYRAGGFSEKRKAGIKELLDSLGMWLERQTVTIGGAEHKLERYPILTGERRFKSISRQTPAYLDSVAENKTEDWQIQISAVYTNEFDR